MKREKALRVPSAKRRNLQSLTVKKSSILSSVPRTTTLALLLLQVIPCLVDGSSSEYLYLNGIGGSMYPTMGERDKVQVKTNVDPASVQIGDIIVYGSIAAAAYVPYPGAMWICHRVVEKCEEGGTWYFRTKGDNNSETDPWKVPAYWLLGVVTKIEHVSIPADTPHADEEPSSFTTPEEMPNILFIGGAAGICLVIGGALAFVIESARRRENPSFFGKGLCYGCRRYEAEHGYNLEQTAGRLGIRRIPSSRGFCKYHNLAVFDGTPESRCSKYKARETAELS